MRTPRMAEVLPGVVAPAPGGEGPGGTFHAVRANTRRCGRVPPGRPHPDRRGMPGTPKFATIFGTPIRGLTDEPSLQPGPAFLPALRGCPGGARGDPGRAPHARARGAGARPRPARYLADGDPAGADLPGRLRPPLPARRLH